MANKYGPFILFNTDIFRFVISFFLPFISLILACHLHLSIALFFLSAHFIVWHFISVSQTLVAFKTPGVLKSLPISRQFENYFLLYIRCMISSRAVQNFYRSPSSVFFSPLIHLLYWTEDLFFPLT